MGRVIAQPGEANGRGPVVEHFRVGQNRDRIEVKQNIEVVFPGPANDGGGVGIGESFFTGHVELFGQAFKHLGSIVLGHVASDVEEQVRRMFLKGGEDFAAAPPHGMAAIVARHEPNAQPIGRAGRSVRGHGIQGAIGGLVVFKGIFHQLAIGFRQGVGHPGVGRHIVPQVRHIKQHVPVKLRDVKGRKLVNNLNKLAFDFQEPLTGHMAQANETKGFGRDNARENALPRAAARFVEGAPTAIGHLAGLGQISPEQQMFHQVPMGIQVLAIEVNRPLIPFKPFRALAHADQGLGNSDVALNPLHFWIHRQGLLPALDSLFLFVGHFKGATHAPVGLGHLRIGLNSPLKTLDRLVRLPLAKQNAAQV